jgi:hypothetical protein
VGVGSGGVGFGVAVGFGVGFGEGFGVGVAFGRGVGVGVAAPPGFGVGRGPGVSAAFGSGVTAGVGETAGASRLGIASPSSALPGGASAFGDGPGASDIAAASSGANVSPSTPPVRPAKIIGPTRSTTMIAIPTAAASRMSWMRGGSSSMTAGSPA